MLKERVVVLEWLQEAVDDKIVSIPSSGSRKNGNPSAFSVAIIPFKTEQVEWEYTRNSTYSNNKKKVVVTGVDGLVSTIPSFETCIQQESCVIMLSTTFSTNGFFKVLKVLKNMQQFGRSSAFASSWHMGAA